MMWTRRQVVAGGAAGALLPAAACGTAVEVGAVKRALGIKRSFGILQRLKRWNRKPQNWREDPQMTPVLRSYFEDDVALLGRLTGRDLSHWLR